jgi:hypothetical protein
MVTAVRVRALELAALLVAIYGLTLTCAIRGVPSPAIAIGLTVDLTVTATVVTWWLGVRHGLVPRRGLYVVFAVGALASHLVLPVGSSRLALGAGIALELCTLALIGMRARRLLRRLRRGAGLPMLLRLADALEDVGVPRRLARIMSTELTTFGMALTGWFRRAPRDGYSIHRTHLTLAFHVVLGGMIVLETFIFHLLLARVSEVGAWIATGSSIYALIWLAGDAHGLRLGRIRIERDAVVIEIARRWAAIVPRRAITAVRRVTAAPEGVSGVALDLALETPTVVLYLSAPITARGPFGLTRTGTVVALTIDDAEGFVAALEWGLGEKDGEGRRAGGQTNPII